MCTVSLVPNARGFFLAMNRDESTTRPAAIPPRVFELNDTRLIYPREPSGGTWISVNDSGVCLALVNWHLIERTPPGEPITRGEVVRNLATANSFSQIEEGLQRLPLSQMRPFRLIAVSNQERRVAEYRSDLNHVLTKYNGWTHRHWFSSGFDEVMAGRLRGRVCREAWNENGAGSLDWLRDLHASHVPEYGPFSICMHQPVAQTVSYTEVALMDRQVTVRYKPGPVCSLGNLQETNLSLAPTGALA